MSYKVSKAIERVDGIIQRYDILPKNLKNYGQAEETWHRFNVLKKEFKVLKKDVETIVLVTVKLVDYGEKGHEINFEINFAKKTLVSQREDTIRELYSKIYNGLSEFFGMGIADVTSFPDLHEVGIAEVEKEECSVRGFNSDELKNMIKKASGRGYVD